jgi:CheY-like chemotaxis protein
VPQTLLLADDSVTIQRVIELTFADEDIRVVAVSDGDQAIAALDKTPPDIVLADVGMPGRSGYDVARHIKETPRFAHIPVVLLTGAFEPIDQAKASTIGCDGVLAKPFEPHLVISRVKELLAKQKPGATSKDAQAGPAPAKASSWPPAPAGRFAALVPVAESRLRSEQRGGSAGAASRGSSRQLTGVAARDTSDIGHRNCAIATAGRRVCGVACGGTGIAGRLFRRAGMAGGRRVFTRRRVGGTHRAGDQTCSRAPFRSCGP